HYRTNQKFFDSVRDILQRRHILFAGFSHRDPEVTNLVEDGIYRFEQRLLAKTRPTSDDRPHFYSLQFDMAEHTPQIFAARGVVALRPPIATGGKSESLGWALGELVLAHDQALHAKESLDGSLRQIAELIEKRIDGALATLAQERNTALEAVIRRNQTQAD